MATRGLSVCKLSKSLSRLPTASSSGERELPRSLDVGPDCWNGKEAVKGLFLYLCFCRPGVLRQIREAAMTYDVLCAVLDPLCPLGR